jgi:hypothetical protein
VLSPDTGGLVTWRVCAAVEGSAIGSAGSDSDGGGGLASLSPGSGMRRAVVEDSASPAGDGVVVDGSVSVPVSATVSLAISIPVSVSLPCPAPSSLSKSSKSDGCPWSLSCESGTSSPGRMGRGGVSEGGGGGGSCDMVR